MITQRYALRDDQWERLQDLLPGSKGWVGVTAKNNRLFVEAVFQQPSRVDSEENRGVIHLRNVDGLLARYSIRQGKILEGGAN